VAWVPIQQDGHVGQLADQINKQGFATLYINFETAHRRGRAGSVG
jgi:hypothetical protein